jgi:hypothetical protein
MRKQRKALALFEESREVTAREIAGVVADASKRARKYRLNDEVEAIVS